MLCPYGDTARLARATGRGCYGWLHIASRCALGFLHIDVFVFYVTLGVGVYCCLVGGRQWALYFAGVAYYQAAGGNFGALQEQGACSYYAAGAYLYTVQDYCAHAYEAAGFYVAAVQGDAVADGYVVAQEQGVCVAHYVEDAAVLDVGAGADADVVDVAADYGAGPDAGVRANDHVADDDGGGVNIGGGSDFWALAAVGADVGLSSQWRAVRAWREG